MSSRNTDKKNTSELVSKTTVAEPGEKWDPITALKQIDDDRKFIMRIKTDGTVERLAVSREFITSKMAKAALSCRVLEVIMLDKAKIALGDRYYYIHMLVDEEGLTGGAVPNVRATEMVKKYCSRGFIYPIVGSAILTLYLE